MDRSNSFLLVMIEWEFDDKSGWVDRRKVQDDAQAAMGRLEFGDEECVGEGVRCEPI